MAVYSSLGVRRVINACGIYTYLGGSVLSPRVLAAAAEAATGWAAMDELLAASGARIAALCGCEAARVVPGASAGIALAVGACVARGDGAAGEALPLAGGTVLMQRVHDYKYVRCVALAGARVEWVDDIVSALGSGAAAVLHPAHLDGAGLPLDELAPFARAAGVPVVVDAAFQSFPLEALRRWSSAGDIACFSAKYFFGPNAGGFVAGRAAVVDDVAALDFVGYESGPWRTFGRAFKLDRSAVAATVAALEEWFESDHDARRRAYADLASALASELGALAGAQVRLRSFTLDEELRVDGPVNAVVVTGGGDLTAALAAREVSVRALADGDATVFCTEALTEHEVREIGAAMSALWPN
jgi:L-seryl-tRNA(Ser) seleniumtransferase